MDNKMSLEADKLLAEQLPDRADIFHNVELQKAELNDFNEKTRTIIAQFEKQLREPKQKHNTIPKNATVKEEYVCPELIPVLIEYYTSLKRIG